MLQKNFNFVYTVATSLNILYNYINYPTKLFSDLYLAKFLDTLTKPFIFCVYKSSYYRNYFVLFGAIFELHLSITQFRARAPPHNEYQMIFHPENLLSAWGDYGRALPSSWMTYAVWRVEKGRSGY